MSLAIPTLTLIFLLTPGLIFRRFYFSGEFSQQYVKSSFTDLLISTLVPNVVIHLLLFQLLVKPDYFIDTDILSILFSGTDDIGKINAGFSNIYKYAREIVIYLTVAAALGALGGWAVKFLVRVLKLDRRFRIFRYKNQWHYLFSGEILDFPNMPGKNEDINVIYVDTLVDTADGSVIYSGILRDYQLGKDGGIDCIYLGEVTRRYLKNDDGTGLYYEMPGNYFVIPFNTIINLHLSYYAVQAEEELQDVLDNINTDN